MSNILSFLGWSFLPDLITNNLQSFYYNLTLRAGEVRPQPSTPTFAKHRRRIYIAVILLYLVYILYEADWQVRREGDYYTLLGVAQDATDREIQSRFRKLTLLHHPDKLPPTTPPSVLARTQTHYHHLTTARETLLSAPHRFAYDRLGPVISTPGWSRLKTTPELIYAGLRNLVPFYSASALGLYLSTWLGFLDQGGNYWRFLALAGLGVVEGYTVTRPWFSPITVTPTLLNPYLKAVASVPGLSGYEAWVRRPYLPFQAVVVAHRALVAFLIALSRLGPLLSSEQGLDTGEGEEALLKVVGRLEQRVQIAAVESARMLALETVPFRVGDGQRSPEREEGTHREGEQEGEQDARAGRTDSGLEKLRGKVKEWFVTNTVRQDKEVQEAVGKLVEQRAREADGAAVPVHLRGMQRQRQRQG